MNRSVLGHWVDSPPVPRTRGDEPEIAAEQKKADAPFPAHAGIDPSPATA